MEVPKQIRKQTPKTFRCFCKQTHFVQNPLRTKSNWMVSKSLTVRAFVIQSSHGVSSSLLIWLWKIVFLRYATFFKNVQFIPTQINTKCLSVCSCCWWNFFKFISEYFQNFKLFPFNLTMYWACVSDDVNSINNISIVRQSFVALIFFLIFVLLLFIHNHNAENMWKHKANSQTSNQNIQHLKCSCFSENFYCYFTWLPLTFSLTWLFFSVFFFQIFFVHDFLV